MTPLVFVETANMATCQWKIANLLGVHDPPLQASFSALFRGRVTGGLFALKTGSCRPVAWSNTFSRQSPCQVAYLRLADKYLGLLASRLRGVNQPVIRTRRGFQPLVTPRWPAFERKVSAPHRSP